MGEILSRWKQGVRDITPLQQSRMVYKNTYIMLIGILAGIVASGFAIKQLWWLEIILVSAFLNTVVVQIGNYQKYIILKTIEEETGGNLNDTS